MKILMMMTLGRLGLLTMFYAVARDFVSKFMSAAYSYESINDVIKEVVKRVSRFEKGS